MATLESIEGKLSRLEARLPDQERERRSVQRLAGFVRDEVENLPPSPLQGSYTRLLTALERTWGA